MQRLQHYLTQITAIITLILVMGGASSLSAAENNIYRVDGIQVNEQAINATKAREQAIENGQKEALYVVLKRMTPASVHFHLPEIEEGKVAAMVHDFEVKDEKITNSRYRAKFDVTFNPEYVRAFLRDNNIAFMESKSPPALVLPILHAGGTTYLWDKTNIWWQAWERASDNTEMLTLVLPLGDLEEVSTVQPDAVLNNDFAYLKPLADKYNASSIIVAEAHQEKDAEGGVKLKVALRSLSAEGGSGSVNSFAGTAGEEVASIYNSAVKDILFRLENEWKGMAMQHEQSTITLEVQVPVKSAAQWAGIKKRLNDLTFLKEMEFKSLSSEKAQINIAYRGKLEDMLARLNEHYFYLMEENNVLLLKSSL